MITLVEIEKLIAETIGDIEARWWLVQVSTALKQERAARARADRIWTLIKDRGNKAP